MFVSASSCLVSLTPPWLRLIRIFLFLNSVFSRNVFPGAALGPSGDMSSTLAFRIVAMACSKTSGLSCVVASMSSNVCVSLSLNSSRIAIWYSDTWNV